MVSGQCGGSRGCRLLGFLVRGGAVSSLFHGFDVFPGHGEGRRVTAQWKRAKGPPTVAKEHDAALRLAFGKSKPFPAVALSVSEQMGGRDGVALGNQQ